VAAISVSATFPRAGDEPMKSLAVAMTLRSKS